MAGEGGRERGEGQQPNMDVIAQNKRASEGKPAAHLIPISLS